MLYYRNEWKYLLSYPEAELLKQRLLPFLHLDSHAQNGQYMIRSLYFDDWRMSSYEEKIMGVMARKKWRIRIYNYSDDQIFLERKIKHGNYIHKERFFGECSRSYYAGENVKEEDIKASFRNGTLEITFPKEDVKKLDEGKKYIEIEE